MSKFQVDHALDDLEADHHYILNLKDANVLDNSSDDNLENQDLQAAFKQKVLMKRKNALLQNTT